MSGGNWQSFKFARRAARVGLPCVYYFHDVTTVRALKTPAALDGLGLVANSAYTARLVAAGASWGPLSGRLPTLGKGEPSFER